MHIWKKFDEHIVKSNKFIPGAFFKMDFHSNCRDLVCFVINVKLLS